MPLIAEIFITSGRHDFDAEQLKMAIIRILEDDAFKIISLAFNHDAKNKLSKNVRQKTRGMAKREDLWAFLHFYRTLGKKEYSCIRYMHI